MEKLREVISQHAKWTDILLYVDRIESSVTTDFSLALENSKALLECISKEICVEYDCPLAASTSMNQTLRAAFNALGYPNSNLVTQVSSALATIGNQIGEMRNMLGATSHGLPLETIRLRNDKVDLLTRDFLIDSIRTVAIFLIRAFEERNMLPIAETETHDEPNYEDFGRFNEYWDDAYGDFGMGHYSFTASQVLYSLDPEAYHYERRNFENETSCVSDEEA